MYLILKADPGGIFEIIFEAVLLSLDIDPTHCWYSIPIFSAAEMTPAALYKGELAVHLQDR